MVVLAGSVHDIEYHVDEHWTLFDIIVRERNKPPVIVMCEVLGRFPDDYDGLEILAYGEIIESPHATLLVTKWEIV
jgi:hypothetical protein